MWAGAQAKDRQGEAALEARPAHCPLFATTEGCWGKIRDLEDYSAARQLKRPGLPLILLQWLGAYTFFIGIACE